MSLCGYGLSIFNKKSRCLIPLEVACSYNLLELPITYYSLTNLLQSVFHLLFHLIYHLLWSKNICSTWPYNLTQVCCIIVLVDLPPGFNSICTSKTCIMRIREIKESRLLWNWTPRKGMCKTNSAYLSQGQAPEFPHGWLNLFASPKYSHYDSVSHSGRMHWTSIARKVTYHNTIPISSHSQLNLIVPLGFRLRSWV